MEDTASAVPGIVIIVDRVLISLFLAAGFAFFAFKTKQKVAADQRVAAAAERIADELTYR